MSAARRWHGEAPFVLEDSAAHECALVALRDRTPGVPTWEWSAFGGRFEDDGDVLVMDDGNAVVGHWDGAVCSTTRATPRSGRCAIRRRSPRVCRRAKTRCGSTASARRRRR